MIYGKVVGNLKCVGCKECFEKIANEQIANLKLKNANLEVLHSNAKIAIKLLKDEIEVLRETDCSNCLLVSKLLEKVVSLLEVWMINLISNLIMIALNIGIYFLQTLMTTKLYSILLSIILIPLLIGQIVVSISNIFKIFKPSQNKVYFIFNIVLLLSNLIFIAFNIYHFFKTAEGVL